MSERDDKLRVEPAEPSNRCGACDEPVKWLRHERTGKSGLINLIKRDNGNIEVDFERGTYRVVSDVAPGLYISHFVTCPGRERFRRQRKLGVETGPF